MGDWQERAALSAKHANSPEPGDYWHEMFTPVLVVLDVGERSVVICDKVKAVDEDGWTWDLSQVTAVPKKEFGDRLRYKSDAMKHKTWATVVPRHLMKFVTAFEESQS